MKIYSIHNEKANPSPGCGIPNIAVTLGGACLRGSDTVHLSGQVCCLHWDRQREAVLLHRGWVLQLSRESGGVTGEKEKEVNLTGVGGDTKTRCEDRKINGRRTWSSLFTVI